MAVDDETKDTTGKLDVNEDTQEIANPLDMPDDELDAAFEASMLEEEIKDLPDEEPEFPIEEEDGDTEEDPSGSEETTKVDPNEDDDDDDSLDGVDQDKFEEVDPAKADDEDEADEEAEAKPEDSEDADETVNFEDEYNRLLTPFKANGREVKIDNVDDAIALMQMGANYNKKMVSLKPNLKLMKMLENNELLSEDKLTYLIDLSKKDPAAITKLIKESGINPLDIDVAKGDEYTPKSYNVDDSDVELDGILDDIRETDSYGTTIDIVGNKWDDSSKKAVLAEPEIIRVLNSHVDSGIYKQIMTVVEKERMLGRLEGQSDLEAYQTIGDRINEAGGFDVQETTPSSTSEAKKVLTPSKKSDDSKQLKSRKKAASSTKGTKTTKKKDDFDPLGMSDADFEKVSSANFI